MAYRTSALFPSNDTDAHFRAWINEINDSLIAFGWVRTSDTGQIDFATVTRPTTVNTYQGYAVYRMDDALQSSCAVFMRLDFGTGAGTNNCSIKVQVGIGSTDGAGTLTGNVSTQAVTSTSTGATASAVTARTAGDAGSFRMHFWGNNVLGTGWTLLVERDQSIVGADTALGVNFVMHYNTANTTGLIKSQFLETAGGNGALNTLVYAALSQQASQSAGGYVGIAPARCELGPLRNPMKTFLLFARTDYTLETTNPVTIYGSSHTYLMLRPNYSGTLNLNGVNADCGVALLWE